MGDGICIEATGWGPLGRGQGFFSAGFETLVLVDAGLAIGILGLIVGALVLELAIWATDEVVDLVSDNAGEMVLET